MDLTETIKYLIPALVVVAPLLIPKVWDWWRESAKNRYENQKILRSSLFHLLQAFEMLKECEFFLACKGFMLDHGLTVFVGKSQFKDQADQIMIHIMNHYEEALESINSDLKEVIKELAKIEPFMALRLSQLKLQRANTGPEMRSNFKLTFSSESALAELREFLAELEKVAIGVAAELDRTYARDTRERIKDLKKITEDSIKRINEEDLASTGDQVESD